MNLQQAIFHTIKDIPDFPKAGILFKDITPIFYNQSLCTKITNAFVEGLVKKPDAIVGIESRGFLFGQMMANALDVPFVMVRKAGKLPGKTLRVDYALEYGEAAIEVQEGAIQPNWSVVIHDDLLATGGTAEAAARLVEQAGAKVMEFNFVIGLDFLNGRDKLVTHTNNIICLVQY